MNILGKVLEQIYFYQTAKFLSKYIFYQIAKLFGANIFFTKLHKSFWNKHIFLPNCKTFWNKYIFLSNCKNFLEQIYFLTNCKRFWSKYIFTKLQNLTDHIYLEIRPLLGIYTAHSGNSLPWFRDNLSVPSSRVKNSKRNILGSSGR